MKKYLKKCPWCERHNKAEVQQNVAGEYFVQCKLCGEKTNNYKTKDKAIDAWNGIGYY